MNAPLAYNYPWYELPDALYPRIAREYLDWGVDTFVFIDPLILECIQKPERIDFLKKLCSDLKVRFISCHAPCGSKYDLDVCKPDLRPQVVPTHIRGMQIATDFGSRTYTVHVGAGPYVFDHVPVPKLRQLCIESLEQLLPEAEKLGIVIAVENSFEAPNSAKEVRAIVDYFGDNPSIGVCYDTGHAHFMSPYPWKKLENYPDSHRFTTWWEGLVEEPNALELLQDKVVTCHMHDNSGYGDLHSMPFDGTLDWNELMPKLFNCPRMLEYQTEQNFHDGMGWAGMSLAPAGGYSIRSQVLAFRKLGFER